MATCLSLFSGAGGLDVGAIAAGTQIIACIENDADSAETLRKNIGHHGTEIVESDIQTVDYGRWNDGTIDVLIGGPPCQPFSKNGYWVKNDNRLVQHDPRNLLGQYLRAVSEVQPRGFLFENVESILHPTNKSEFSRFVSVSENLGYRCLIYKSNAADFGVPQKRKRVFVFGVKGARHSMDPPTPTHSDHTKKRAQTSLPSYEGVGPYIRKFSTDIFRELEEDASTGTYYYELTSVPAGNNYIALSALPNYTGRTFRTGARFWNFLQKLHPDEPSITIAAQPGPWVGPFHWNNRRLRVPEIAAIQTFPEDYRFSGNRRSIQRQIGNAVPCLLARTMMAHLLDRL